MVILPGIAFYGVQLLISWQK